MLTKTQTEIMKVFASKITESFSIKQVSEAIHKPYPLVHRSAKQLITDQLIIKNKQNLLSLNYKENHPELAYVEALRTNEFLNKNKTVSLFVKDGLKGINLDYFTFLIFGSSIKKRNPGDIDVLLIIEDVNKISNMEKTLRNISSNFSLNFDINIVSAESIYEMLAKRDEANVMNETLDNHIIIFGGETYYRMLKNAR